MPAGSRAGLGLTKQEEGLAPAVCVLSCFLGLDHVVSGVGVATPHLRVSLKRAQVPQICPGTSSTWLHRGLDAACSWA